MKLEKSQYGLRQALRPWNQHIHKLILSLIFVQRSEGHCVYKTVVDNHVVMLAVFVDDMLIACEDDTTLTSAKDKIFLPASKVA